MWSKFFINIKFYLINIFPVCTFECMYRLDFDAYSSPQTLHSYLIPAVHKQRCVYFHEKLSPPPRSNFFFPTRLVCFRALIAELSSFSFSFPRSLKIILNVFTFYNNNSCVSKTSIFRKLIVIFIYFIFINFYIYTRNILKKCEIFKKKGL